MPASCLICSSCDCLSSPSELSCSSSCSCSFPSCPFQPSSTVKESLDYIRTGFYSVHLAEEGGHGEARKGWQGHGLAEQIFISSFFFAYSTCSWIEYSWCLPLSFILKTKEKKSFFLHIHCQPNPNVYLLHLDVNGILWLRCQQYFFLLYNLIIFLFPVFNGRPKEEKLGHVCQCPFRLQSWLTTHTSYRMHGAELCTHAYVNSRNYVHM